MSLTIPELVTMMVLSAKNIHTEGGTPRRGMFLVRPVIMIPSRWYSLLGVNQVDATNGNVNRLIQW